MKKLLYFLPLIICVLIVVFAWISDVLYFTDYLLLVLNMTVMFLAGVLMCKGKAWGAYLAIAFYAGWSIWDYYVKYLPSLNNTDPFGVVNMHIPVYSTGVFVIIFYLYCVYKIKKEK